MCFIPPFGEPKKRSQVTDMVAMVVIIGEICNFCAYAFVEAILVTPLGALVGSLLLVPLLIFSNSLGSSLSS